MPHTVYILECADKTLYTGYTTNVEQRLIEHNTSKKAAKYTRGRRPLVLVYSETCANRSAGLQREAQIKKLSRDEKMKLVRRMRE